MTQFSSRKIPIIDSIDALKQFIEKYPGHQFCLYLAFKDPDGWERSTSRVYMNQVLDKLIYLPVNILKGDNVSIKKIYELAQNEKQIIAINQTQPHKSNPVGKQKFSGKNVPENIDTIIKDSDENLIPYDLNAPSFISWFLEEAGSITGKTIVLFGVGGVGETIARGRSKQDL